MNIFEVGEFFECRQILDTDTNRRHPTTIVINKLEAVQLQMQVGRFPKLKKYLSIRGYQKH